MQYIQSTTLKNDVTLISCLPLQSVDRHAYIHPVLYNGPSFSQLLQDMMAIPTESLTDWAGFLQNRCLSKKYVGPPYCWSEMYTGHVVCCPLPSHSSKYADEMDGRQTVKLRFPLDAASITRSKHFVHFVSAFLATKCESVPSLKQRQMLPCIKALKTLKAMTSPTGSHSHPFRIHPTTPEESRAPFTPILQPQRLCIHDHQSPETTDQLTERF